MLDRNGYRPNVGIILLNRRNEVFWGKRIREPSWQFPQGGIKRGESPEQAMFRELHEEVGLRPEHVRIIGRTRNWLHYDVPMRWVRREWRGHYRGQKQIWFLLRLVGSDEDVSLEATSHPEFDAWRWNPFWVPLDAVIEFKRQVYEQALTELARLLLRDVPDDAQTQVLRVFTSREEYVSATVTAVEADLLCPPAQALSLNRSRDTAAVQGLSQALHADPPEPERLPSLDTGGGRTAPAPASGRSVQADPEAAANAEVVAALPRKRRRRGGRGRGRTVAQARASKPGR